MLITSVRVTPIEREKVLAVVTITLSDCFVLRAMRLMQGRSRDYVAMPVRQTGQGGVFEVFHPINRQARDVLEQVVTRGYANRTADRDADVDMPVRIGSESPDFVITGVRVKTFEEQKLRGFASMVIDDCLAVNGIKIIAGKQRRFVQMPNVRRKSGKFRDLAFPIKPEIRQLIEETVFRAYEESLGED
ncbi:MAG: SpoVG family protein [Candidatus Eisenbacteria bacterium]